MSSDVEMNSSDVEMSDSDQSGNGSNTLRAYKRGPERLMHKGDLYTRKQHQDATRAFTKSSIIWKFGDEYEKGGNSRQRVKSWRCELCNKTTLLVMTDNSSSGLRHLKNKHNIDKNRKAIQT